MIAKRLFDVFSSLVGLLILAPLLVLVALLIKYDSAGPVFFRQERVGLNGRVFRIHKFRTMVAESESKGLQITAGADKRITKIGTYLRKYKIDELPQLIDVLVGNMSVVGPRPEVPSYMACYPDEVRRLVLSVRPGITDKAAIEYKDENLTLGEATDPHRAYVEEILPKKQAFYVDYVNGRSFLGDIKIVFRTLLEIIR